MATPTTAFTWKIGGPSGGGMRITGLMFSRLCVRHGYHFHDYAEYPSLIHGGHHSFQVTVSPEPVRSPHASVDMLVAFHQETLDQHAGELAPNAVVLYDADDQSINIGNLGASGAHLLPIPFVRLAKANGGSSLMQNIVALGATAALMGADTAILESVIHTAFDRKGEQVVGGNIRSAHAGYAYVKEQAKVHVPFHLAKKQEPARLVLTGNTGVALGAVEAGVTYFAGYPMTPTTSILTFLAGKAEELGIVVRQPEDEISVINGAIGASYAGARAMVATSGGGFSLMVEGVGLANMTETPLVIVLGQRPGPSTGLPTWTSQADLRFALHASQDEAPRILVAPGDAEECFYATFNACNLAEKYQLPVFLLTDKFLGECSSDVTPLSEQHLVVHRGAIEEHPQENERGLFARYRDTETGVSPRTLPGTPGGVFIANSDEHDAYGIVSEDRANRKTMMTKRAKKLRTAVGELPLPVLYGDHSADVTLIGWGSTKGPLLDAAAILRRRGASVNVLHFVYVWPFPNERLKPLLKGLAKTIGVENNSSGQFCGLLKEACGFVVDDMVTQDDGRPFFADVLADTLSERIAKLL